MTNQQQQRAAAQREREVRDKRFERKLDAYPVPYVTLPPEPAGNEEELISAAQ